MSDWKELADILFPDVTETIQDLQDKFPQRANPIASRFAPSPTWFLHIGGVYTAFIAWKFVKQNDGTFILRIEDTDQKRQVDGALQKVIDSMKTFNITIDEGPIWEANTDVGNYWPYTQSQRKHLYHVFVKELVAQGKAYPCWMSPEELESTRDQQMKAKIMPGIYGNYSVWRNKTVDEIKEQLSQNKDFVIRFRSHADTQKKIIFDDVLRGKINMTDNYNDIVVMKSDGLPTYHLAHIVDDTLMRVSHVIRAEEWLTSVPLHLQLFEAFDIPAPKYVHLAPLLKTEDGKKRKLSKRKDPEADIQFFFEHGYSVEGILEYLLNLADSGFEDFLRENPDKWYNDYELHIEKMWKAGSLFDITKMESVNNNYLSRLSTDDLYDQSLSRAEIYNTELAELLKSDPEYAKAAIDIERHTEKDPKRFYTYKDVDTQIRFFFDSEWEKLLPNKPELPESLTQEVINNFVNGYVDILDLNMSLEDWFAQLKEFGKTIWFATNNKEFKEWWYIGKVWELAMLLRVQLCCSWRTPDLYSVMKVMWKDRVVSRLKQLVK